MSQSKGVRTDSDLQRIQKAPSFQPGLLLFAKSKTIKKRLNIILKLK